MVTILEALAIAIQHHQAGRLQVAEQMYRQILDVEPDQPDALHLFGLLAHQAGKHETAVECIGRAIGLKRTEATYHNNLGNVFQDQRKLEEAVACYHRALELEPDFAEAHCNLGVAFKDQGKLSEAVACFRRVLELRPDSTDAYNNLGVALQNQRKLDEALACYRRALELEPDFVQAHCNLGNTLKHQGQLEQAAACYRRALELKPDFAEVHHHLGDVLQDQGKLTEAIACYRRAVELKPQYAEVHNNLGVALIHQGKPDEAIACYRRAVELKPDYAEAIYNLGAVLKDQRKLSEAVACYRRAIELKPEFAAAHNNLGIAWQELGKLDEALACYRRALELHPGYAEAHSNLGNAWKDQGKLGEAVACYRRALELKPDYAEAHSNLGAVYKNQGKLSEAVACCRRALELNPDYAAAHYNLGVIFSGQGKLDEAIACYRRALELQPEFAAAHNNLGSAWKDQGKLSEAIACYRRALEINPDFDEAHSNLVYTLTFCPGHDAQAIYEAHRRWDQQHAAPLARLIQPHRNHRSAERRLRLGYVSPDFRNHVVGRNLLPLFRERDRQRFECFCYANVSCPDELTHQFQGYADVWRNTAGLTDEQLAQRICADGIDILVDLSLHMNHNRLLVFARKPAPVQVTFAGYPGTTGLSTIDYRLTDPHLDPPDLFDRCYSEQSIRLPDSFWCYEAMDGEPAVNALPAAEKGYISFGCLNNFCKVNPPVLKIWARVLQAVERSRLVLLAGEGSHRQYTLDLLATEGVAHDRVAFLDSRPRAEYLRHYHGLDIALDTIPYNGHTTSLDSFWMGVPVVTLAGPTVVGRAGLCQLMNLGLPELIASNVEQYVRIAVELAHDLPRLRALRATLRDRMQASPLMDAPRFARNVEAAYREMWRRWCVR